MRHGMAQRYMLGKTELLNQPIHLVPVHTSTRNPLTAWYTDIMENIAVSLCLSSYALHIFFWNYNGIMHVRLESFKILPMAVTMTANLQTFSRAGYVS